MTSPAPTPEAPKGGRVCRIHYDARMPKGRQYLASFSDYPGCMVEGGTVQEAYAILCEVWPNFVAALTEMGCTFERPEFMPAPPVESIDWKETSTSD